MTQKEFDVKFRNSIDKALENMAGSSEIDLKKFFGMVYFFENLAFLSPVLYALMDKPEIKE